MRVSLEKLLAVETVGRSGKVGIWRPLPHGELVGELTSACEKAGMKAVSERYELGYGGDRCWVMLTLTGVGREIGLWRPFAIVLRNSNDRNFAIGYTAGAEIEGVGMVFKAGFRAFRKHTRGGKRGIPELGDLSETLVKIVESAVGEAHGIVEWHNGLGGCALDKGAWGALSVEAADHKLISLNSYLRLMGKEKPVRFPDTLGEWYDICARSICDRAERVIGIPTWVEKSVKLAEIANREMSRVSLKMTGI